MGNSSEANGVNCHACGVRMANNNWKFEHIADKVYCFWTDYGVGKVLSYLRIGGSGKYWCPWCFDAHAPKDAKQAANICCASSGISAPPKLF